MNRVRLGPQVTAAGALAALLIQALPANANPWTRDSGNVYLNLNYSLIAASGVYLPDGGRRDFPDNDRDGNPDRYLQHTVGLYSEIGVIDRWLTATVNLTLLRHSSLTQQASDESFAQRISAVGAGDMAVGLWSGLLTWPLRVTIGVVFGIPTGDPVPKADDEETQLTANFLPTGDGEWDAQFVAEVGYALGGGAYPLLHYGLASAGYWLRTTPRDVGFGNPQDFPDAFNWRIEIGTKLPWTFVDRFWFIVRFFGSESFASLADPQGMSAGANPSGLGGGVTYRSFGLEIFGRIWRTLGASAGVSGAFFARNLPAAPYIRFALSYEL